MTPHNLTASTGGTNVVASVDAQIRAWEEGRDYANRGESITACPFEAGSMLARIWLRGYDEALDGESNDDIPASDRTIIHRPLAEVYGDETESMVTVPDEVCPRCKAVNAGTWFDRCLDENGCMATRCNACGCDIYRAPEPEPEPVARPEPQPAGPNWFWIAYIVVLSAVLLCAVVYGCSEAK